MVEQFGIDYVIGGLILFYLLGAYQMDRFSRRALDHIDRLQTRVRELEERLGIEP